MKTKIGSNGRPVVASARRLVFLIIVSGLAGAQAGELDVRHGGPIIGLFGLPAPAENRTLGADEGLRVDLLVQGASHAIGEVAGEEQLLLDGESWRIALRLRTRLADRWELGIEVPWLRHSGGSLDGLIDDWHALFGLPDGNRNLRPSDAIRFLYRNPAGETLDFGDSASGLGDIRLSAGYLLQRDATGTLSLRAGVELPTGDSNEFTGNGASDVSLGVAWERNAFGGGDRWQAYLAGGVIRYGKGDLPAVDTRDWGGWLHASTGWRITRGFELLAQLQGATSPLDSDLDAWGGSSLMLSLGAGIELGARYRLEFGFSEDIAVETAPDITFLARLTRH